MIKPISLRHGTPDAELLIETALASGIFEIEGGPIYLFTIFKKLSLDKTFMYWKYVERVCTNYSKLNEPINRESFGPLTATLVPPCITIVIQLCIEMLLSLEEGVKSFLYLSQTGSMIQDIVTANVLRKMAKHYAEQIGCGDAMINLVTTNGWEHFPQIKISQNH